jgi:hypothetical protein
VALTLRGRAVDPALAARIEAAVAALAAPEPEASGAAR